MSLNSKFTRVAMRGSNSRCIFATLMAAVHVFLIKLSDGQQRRTVRIFDRVHFPCDSDPLQKRLWEHENDVLFLNELKINFNLDNIRLLDSYALLIQTVTLSHEGIYRCFQGDSVVAEFLLIVEVPPKMLLSMNESDNVTYIEAEAGTEVTLFCHALGAIPPVNLSWTTDEKNGNHHELNFTVRSGGEYQGVKVFDSVSVHNFRLTNNNGVISCRSRSSNGHGNREICLQYSTFVLPDLEITLNDASVKSEVYIPMQKPVFVTCRAFGSRPASNLFWFINNFLLNGSHVANETIIHSNNSFDTVSSLIFTPQDTSGLITCVSKLVNRRYPQREINMTYYNYRIPKLQMSIDGNEGTENIPVAANEPMQVVCNASSSRPKSYISWHVNDMPIEKEGEINETTFYIEHSDAIFDTISVLRYQPKELNASITCRSHFNSTGEVARVDAPYFTYVVPDMYFIINGNKWRNISTINVTSNQILTVICHADGTRPVIQLRWKLKARNIDNRSVLISKREDATFNLKSFLTFRPNETETDVMCFTRGLFNRNVFIVAYIHVTEADSFQDKIQLWMILCVTLVILLLIAVPSCCLFVRKYLGGSTSRSLKHNIKHEYEVHGNFVTNLNSSLPEDSQRKHVLEGLDLPEVPCGTDSSDYSPLPENNYDSYFELKDNSSNHKMFRGKDMCLILKLNSGHMCSRWMGTMHLSNHQKKCVVLSTVSDVTAKSGEIQWDTYVKRILDMPDHKSIVRLEGICVNQANLYLVHEHLTCDSLESIIISKRTAKDRCGPLPTSQVTSYLMDILEGMEVLHSFGFLHPEFSTRKVLVTDTGHCKLYNFFLSEDASNKTSNMKSMKKCSLSDLPPEALFRNEYTQASDVWCVAVVLWNLMTYDSIPVVVEAMNEKKICNIHSEWPASHLNLKNNILFDCWVYDESLRPSINKLRSSFTEVLQKGKAFASSEDFTESMTDLYTPMDRI